MKNNRSSRIFQVGQTISRYTQTSESIRLGVTFGNLGEWQRSVIWSYYGVYQGHKTNLKKQGTIASNGRGTIGHRMTQGIKDSFVGGALVRAYFTEYVQVWTEVEGLVKYC
jgi:hypothetical protein